jgi:hypothetical protein
MVSTSVLGISVCTAATFFFWRQLEQSLVLTETYCSLDDGRTEFSDSKVLGGVWPVERLWLKYRGIPESSLTWIGTDHPIGAPVACLAVNAKPNHRLSDCRRKTMKPERALILSLESVSALTVLQVVPFLSFSLHLLFSTLLFDSLG